MKELGFKDKVEAQGRAAARAAIERGDAPPKSRFFIQVDKDPDGDSIYSLWLCLWGSESELIQVLEVN